MNVSVSLSGRVRSGILVAAVVLAFGPTASAGESCPPASWVKVVDLTKEAKVLLDGKRYDEAIAKLRAAYGVCPEPKLRRSMGRVQEEAGHLEEALTAFRACVDESADDAVRTECQERVKTIGERLGSATIVVDAIPPSAMVILDGSEDAHPAGQPIRVRPGRHAIELRAAGKAPYRTTVDARGGQETRVPVVMEAPPAPPAPVLTGVHPASPRLPAAAPVTARAFAPQTKWNWVGVGLGSLATGVGLAFLIQYGLDRSNAQGRHDDGTYIYAADKVGPRNLAIGVTFLAVGAAGVVVSAVLWPKVPVKAAAGLIPGGGSLAFSFGY